MCNRLFVMALVFFVACFSPLFAHAAGGSNYAWYRVDVVKDSAGVPISCNREPYGVVVNYHNVTVRNAVRTQLSGMRQSGQQRIVLPIFYGHGISTGTVLNSSSGALSSRDSTNFSNLLSDIRKAGFSELLVKFVPIGDISPVNWTGSWSAAHQSFYEEARAFIFSAKDVLDRSGVFYRIDLMGEGMPPGQPGTNAPYYPNWSRYVSQLWGDFVLLYGKNNTVGYSVPVGFDIDARVRHFSYVYGQNLPYLFSFHIYGDSASAAYSDFVRVDGLVRANGYTQGWIIGETFFNDLGTAQSLRNAVTATRRTVFYIAQWPLSRFARENSPNENCRVHVSESSVVPYANYSAFGF